MRQVGVGKALAVGVLAVAVSAAISGGAVHMMNRHKVAFGYVDEYVVIRACAVMRLMKEAYPGIRVALHPSVFDPSKYPPQK